MAGNNNNFMEWITDFLTKIDNMKFVYFGFNFEYSSARAIS